MKLPGYDSVHHTAVKWEMNWSTVRYWCMTGRIPGAIFQGGRYFIPADADPDDVLPPPPLTPEQRAEIKRRQMAGRAVSSSSGYRGVYRRRGRWAAIISIAGKPVHVGSYGTREEAARAWDKRARELRGADTLVNFPDE